jgi:hypothetical protein
MSLASLGLTAVSRNGGVPPSAQLTIMTSACRRLAPQKLAPARLTTTGPRWRLMIF